MILKNFTKNGKKKFPRKKLYIMSINLSNVKVEIVLPNYNSAPYLEETINSIINQTFENWNLTIVDGNSNNDTHQILKKYCLLMNQHST